MGTRMTFEGFFPMTGRPPCPECQQPTGVALRVSDEGFSCGETIEHLSECSKLRCPHGVRWQEDCAQCEADGTFDDEGDGTQPPSGLRGDPVAPRTVNAPTRGSSSSEDS